MNLGPHLRRGPAHQPQSVSYESLEGVSRTRRANACRAPPPPGKPCSTTLPGLDLSSSLRLCTAAPRRRRGAWGGEAPGCSPDCRRPAPSSSSSSLAPILPGAWRPRASPVPPPGPPGLTPAPSRRRSARSEAEPGLPPALGPPSRLPARCPRPTPADPSAARAAGAVGTYLLGKVTR